MDKGKKKKSHKNKNRNKEAVEFILANRDAEDPNFNNPNVNKKILLQVNKDEDLTENQKKIIESIPKIERGIFDEDAKIKLMTQNMDNKDDITTNTDDSKQKEKKGVKFDFDNNEIINYDKKKKVEEIQKEKLINDIRNKKIDISKIEDEEKVKEIFKNLKVNAKIVEYNDLGLKKDTAPEILDLVTDKEFIEGVDIFVPAPKDNDGKVIEDYDNDMNEENMNDEYKELEKELRSDDEEEKKIKNPQTQIPEEKNEKNEKKEDGGEEEISTSTKKESVVENKDIDIKGDLEDDFVLLANGGELPVELISEQEKEDLEKNNKEKNKNNNEDKMYKFISQKEIEYVEKKFLMDDNEEKAGKKKGNFISQKEFNDAINEILNSKKGKSDKDKNQIERVMGLKKSILDEEEFEEYELSEEDEEWNNIEQEKEKEKEKNKNEIKTNNIDNKKLKDIITKKNIEKEKEDDLEEDEEEEGEEQEFHPQIKIEYVSREDEPAPFDKDSKIKKKRKNKKEFKKSRTKQYEQLKANGELSDESFDREKLDELLHDEEYVKKTKELIDTNFDEEKNINEVDKEIEKKYNVEPKIQKDITQTTDKIINLPKTIKQEKKEKIFSKKEKTEEEKGEGEKIENKKEINNINDDNEKKKETKEDKALRKKLLKMERKERRIEKKKLKNAFKEEKVTQQRQIAQANKIVRYGLSVKDI